ncbi:hypothetical protein CHCC20333_4778 [Bacillus paralicheniformis]|nr:hypothetical protein CHCC20333_4778 [Bacillus paralicheniformis]
MVKKCNRANKRSYLKEKDLKGPLFYERAFFITSVTIQFSLSSSVRKYRPQTAHA